MTRDQLIETMARGICVALGHDPDGPTCDVYSPSDPHMGEPWAGYRREATAALTAIDAAGMRVVPVELTERMWLEARSVGQHEGDWCTNVWEAMLAAAQEDSTSE